MFETNNNSVKFFWILKERFLKPFVLELLFHLSCLCQQYICFHYFWELWRAQRKILFASPLLIWLFYTIENPSPFLHPFTPNPDHWWGWVQGIFVFTPTLGRHVCFVFLKTLIRKTMNFVKCLIYSVNMITYEWKLTLND